MILSFCRGPSSDQDSLIWETESRRITVQGQPRQIVHKAPISKITRVKWIRGVAQEAEHLLCKHKALSSNSTPALPFLPYPPAKKDCPQPSLADLLSSGIKMETHLLSTAPPAAPLLKHDLSSPCCSILSFLLNKKFPVTLTSKVHE
jgi:hypothetical protein